MNRLKDQKGQSIVEYVILVALVSLVCVSASKALGTKINSKINQVTKKIDSGISVTLSPR